MGWRDAYVRVARQNCGRLGKVDNCQVGVYSAMVRQDEVCLNNAGLYLLKTKGKIAAEMAYEYFSKGNAAYWVGGDCVYGDSPDLKEYLDSIG